MSSNIGRYRPSYPHAGKIIEKISRFPVKAIGAWLKFHSFESRFASKKGQEMQERLKLGETLYLLGLGPSGHNSAAALVEVSTKRGVNVICNNEDERYTGIKNDGQFPVNSLNDVFDSLNKLGLSPKDIFAVVGSWDYIKGISTGFRLAVEEAPVSFYLIRREASPHMNFWHFIGALKAPSQLKHFFGTNRRIPIIGMRHHNNHAYYPYAMSPFSGSKDPTMIIVMDGFGDDGSISHFVAKNNNLELVRNYPGIFDSQGLLYAVISSTQGGWEPLSSEGRYMGASAWGDMNRLTNPYYKCLRQILYFSSEGQVYVNRSLINYHRLGQGKPYNKRLTKILGEPIPPDKIWNPDIVLNVDDIEHAEITQERVDKAAALQMVYEDALFHMVDYLIRLTGSRKLILSGGTALNCLANMKLLDHFNEDFYRRTLKKENTRLHLWVPPNPSDTGTAMGAAYQFAMRNGVKPGDRMKHAFICGNSPEPGDIKKAIDEAENTKSFSLGNINQTSELKQIADFAAYIVSQNGIIGMYQGAGETGPRALGHRTILANPCNPKTLELLNTQVKFRERIRPLAPMVTLEHAKRFYHLSEGASDDRYNAYNYMVLTVQAKKESSELIPAVIHKDGTSRIQICRKETDPLSYTILKAMKKYLGVEVAVNTSLNVGTPIVHSPSQAIKAMHRSKGLTGLLMIEENGNVYLVWHNIIKPPKDGGKKLMKWFETWESRYDKKKSMEGQENLSKQL